jgi:hypothetical protein
MIFQDTHVDKLRVGNEKKKVVWVPVRMEHMQIFSDGSSGGAGGA